MTRSELVSLQKATPFRPFTLQLADGDRVHVRHPELLLITPGGRTIVAAASDDTLKIIDLLLVSAIDVGNGSRTSADEGK